MVSSSISKLALDLAGFPMEIVHQILDNTPVLRVLELIAYDNEFLNRCLCAHLYFGKLFTNKDDLVTVKRMFLLGFNENNHPAEFLATDAILTDSTNLMTTLKALHVSASSKKATKYSVPTEPPKREPFFYASSDSHSKVVANRSVELVMHAHDVAQINWLQDILKACAELEREDGID
ncbi:MAG: hypothetical protein MMC33_004977 [Icmadophila ericetorum]|nr:hypothetical protein [Icmadophila ericetorum]